MFARLRFLCPLYLAIVGAVAACSLNPQPEPPMNEGDPSSLPDARMDGSGGGSKGGSGGTAKGGSGGSSMGGKSGAAGSISGSGGSVLLDASQQDVQPPNDEGGCFDCNCACPGAGADGGCEGGWQPDADPDAMCPCEAGTQDADAADSDASQPDASDTANDSVQTD